MNCLSAKIHFGLNSTTVFNVDGSQDQEAYFCCSVLATNGEYHRQFLNHLEIRVMGVIAALQAKVIFICFVENSHCK